jgi:hypothetical protein
VTKVCSVDFLIKTVSEEKIQTLVEQLVLKLLTNGLEHLGEKEEGQNMF